MNAASVLTMSPRRSSVPTQSISAVLSLIFLIIAFSAKVGQYLTYDVGRRRRKRQIFKMSEHESPRRELMTKLDAAESAGCEVILRKVLDDAGNPDPASCELDEKIARRELDRRTECTLTEEAV